MFVPRGILLLHLLLSVTTLCFLLPVLAQLLSHAFYALIMFLFHLTLLRILFLFASLPPITIVLLSLTLLVVLNSERDRQVQ